MLFFYTFFSIISFFIKKEDFDKISVILKDSEIMYTWGKGYALEGIKVAKNLKMSKKDQYNRVYDGKTMLHYVYSISRNEFLNDITT